MTEEAAVANIKQKGIDINLARGESGKSAADEFKPIWASLQKPNWNKISVEFSVGENDPRWIIKPVTPGGDATFNDSIHPDEIIAIHLPWHHFYRHLMNDNKLKNNALQGKFDGLLKSKPDSDEAKAVQYIKLKHSTIV